MEDDLFDDFITGIKQMKLIEKGELEPAKVTVLKLEKAYLAERAIRGNREAFERVLAKVPDVEPDEVDRF